MGGGYVADRVRQTSWSLLVLCTCLIAGTAAIGICARNSVYNAIAGPFPVPEEQLLAPRSDPRQTYLTVHFDRMRDTQFIRKELVNGVETGKVARRYFATRDLGAGPPAPHRSAG